MRKKAIFGPGALTAFGLHKGLDYLGHALLRRKPNKFYAGMSRAGLEDGLGVGKGISAKFRQGVGITAPTLSGMSDYEFSRTLGQTVKKHIPATSGQLPEELISPLSDLSGKLQSPLLKNLAAGVIQDKEPGVISALKQVPGNDDPVGAGRIGMGLSTALTLPFKGVEGALGTGLAVLPDAVGLKGANKGILSTLKVLKLRSLLAGFTGAPVSRMDKLTHFLSPAAKEFRQMGGDFSLIKQHLAQSQDPLHQAVLRKITAYERLARRKTNSLSDALSQDYQKAKELFRPATV